MQLHAGFGYVLRHRSAASGVRCSTGREPWRYTGASDATTGISQRTPVLGPVAHESVGNTHEGPPSEGVVGGRPNIRQWWLGLTTINGSSAS